MNIEGAFSHGTALWQKAFAIIALVLLPLSQANAANITSASLTGSVVDQLGQPVNGASVIVVHQPTGATKSIESNDSGSFFQAGLRIGGPYTVTVRATGYRETVTENIFLRAGSQSPYRVRMVREGASVEEVVVVGNRIEGRDLNGGVGSFFNEDDITNQPSTQRDVIRTLLRDPLASSTGEGNLSVGGVNPRFNALAIDGSLQQDDFGLGSNTYATSRSPINLDAIESASLVATDYSVVVSGFTGGLVNVNTKSGTNEFDGSAFYYYQDQDFLGDDYDGGSVTFGQFEEEEYGFTLGGPILQDRLFFFVSYDEYETQNPVDFSGADRNNGIEPGFFEALGAQIQSTTGFDPGGRPQSGTTPETSERTLLKLDANLSDQHRASVTYQNTEETGTSVGSTNFISAWYDTPVELESYTAQLFSDWTPQLSTTLRYNYKEFSRGQNCRAGAGVGAIEVVDLDPDDLVGTPLDGLLGRETSFVAGCDRFRHANTFDDERTQFFASADYQWGDHVTTVGAEYEEYELANLFVASSRGRYRFFGYDDLVAGDARVDYVNVPSNNAQDGAAAWGYDKVSLFAQDVWQLTPELEVNFGLRYERFQQDDEPARDATLAATYGVDSTANLDGLDLFQPRVGFRWDALPSTTFSGGFGLFAGGNPQVWVSNAFQPPTVFARSNVDATTLDVFNVPQANLDAVAAGNPVAIDTISDNFEIPSDWKASLRMDHDFDARIGDFDLGEDYTLTVQYLYTKTRDGFLWTNRAQTDLAAALPTGTAPDGRIIYADLDDLGIANLTELGNYDDGDAHTITIGLAKRFDNGFEFAVNYAYQDVEITTEGTSSRGISNWRGIQSTDRNDPGAEIAPFEIEHSFKFSLGYERDFLPGLTTRVDLFGRLFKSQPFGYTFDVSSRNSLFGRAGLGESPFDNAPLYVPSGPNDPLVFFAPGFDQAAFFEYVDAKGIGSGINTVRGENGNWNNIWDFQLQQELPGIPGIDRFVGENRLKLVFVVDNFLNLLNDDWGKFTNGPSNADQDIVSADLVTRNSATTNIATAPALTGDDMRTTCVAAADCVYRFNRFFNEESYDTSPTRSVYRIRVGIRMDF